LDKQGESILFRLLKSARQRRSPHPSSLRRTFKYPSLLGISGALHPGIFDQPEKMTLSTGFIALISKAESTAEWRESKNDFFGYF
jgi:hypothetical protein